MATTFIQNLEKLNTAGVKMPANTPSAVAPDNITHCQLRYTPWTDSEIIQGSVVTGENSTFSFSIPDLQIAYVFKLYTSTDGITYTENKTFGGDNGKTLFGTNDLSGVVLLTGNQTIAGIKTFTSIPECATTPTTASQLTRKGYVDAAYQSICLFVNNWIPNAGAGSVTSTVMFNNTGRTITAADVAAGLRITIGGAAITAIGINITSGIDDFDEVKELSLTNAFAPDSLNAWNITYNASGWSGTEINKVFIEIKIYA